LTSSLAAHAGQLQNVELLGARSREEVLELMKAAAVLIIPSLWYEGFPMTVVEAFACGLPVIASDLGSLSSLVPDGISGLLFKPGDATALAGCVNQIFDSQQMLHSMRKAVRVSYDRMYSSGPAYSALMSVYKAAQHRLGPPVSQELAHVQM